MRIILLLIMMIQASGLFGQELESDIQIEYSNIEAEVVLQKIYLDYIDKNFLLIQVEVCEVDSNNSLDVQKGEILDVIYDANWFKSEIDFQSRYRLNLCDFRYYHYLVRGGTVGHLHYQQDSCYIKPLINDIKDHHLKICPKGHRLLLCADVIN